jgi:hypothetical protein
VGRINRRIIVQAGPSQNENKNQKKGTGGMVKVV